MKIIFFGSSQFAVPALKLINNKEEIVLVVTQPDRKKGRSLKETPTPVKELAEELGIEVFQHENINSDDSLNYLKKFDADIFVVVSFGQILKNPILELPRLYPLNIHASLLPKYRGAAPINWAIANGEKETGVTIIKMNEKMDEGDILLKSRCIIDPLMNSEELARKLSKKGAESILEAINMIKDNKTSFVPQEEALVSYAQKLKKEDGLINWRATSSEISNRVRAFVPWPGCYTFLEGKMIKIWKARPNGLSDYPDSKAGTILELEKSHIRIACGKNTTLDIQEVQLEGSRRMNAEEFIIGHRKIAPGVIL